MAFMIPGILEYGGRWHIGLAYWAFMASLVMQYYSTESEARLNP